MKTAIRNSAITLLLLFVLSACSSEDYPVVSIDISDTGQPIEKYIYGQFIEHLGRCIYGGIWAEMVEDRKFYYPVEEDFEPFATATDPFWDTGPYQYLNASPWEIIGEGKNVQMELSEPYTGEHSVNVFVPGDGSAAGIRQYGLGLVQGKQYTGRIILKGESASLPIFVRLSSDDKNIEVQVNEMEPEYHAAAFEFDSPFSSDSAVLEIYSEGSGSFTIGTLSIMPADNINGWRGYNW
ncbi:MAG: hypothetical protein P8100_15675 [bacterium]